MRIPHLPIVDVHRISDLCDTRLALIVTAPLAWHAVADQLQGISHAHHVWCSEATVAAWDQAIAALPHHDFAVIYAVGGGLAVDMAKYIACHFTIPLICIPTALSVDAFLTPASGIRRDGCVYYIPTKAPDTLVLDLTVIAQAPAPIRAAGITDVLSIATGAWDWQFAHERGQNPTHMPFVPWAYDMAQHILRTSIECATAAGRGDHGGLTVLFDMLALEVQLCHQLGHSRPEEGSEHYFAYAIESIVGHGMAHGELVGPGILHMAARQGLAVAPLHDALVACHIPLQRLTQHDIDATMALLPDYCATHKLPFGIAHLPVETH
ncbi:MAG: iron-containing alcohol dehydrogenase [Roseiflexaceae bacterium]